MFVSETDLHELDYLKLSAPLEHLEVTLEIELLGVVGDQLNHAVTNKCCLEGLEDCLFHHHVSIEQLRFNLLFVGAIALKRRLVLKHLFNLGFCEFLPFII